MYMSLRIQSVFLGFLNLLKLWLTYDRTKKILFKHEWMINYAWLTHPCQTHNNYQIDDSSTYRSKYFGVFL